MGGDLTEDDFKAAMLRYCDIRAGSSWVTHRMIDTAFDEFLADLGVEYGNPEFEWSREAAEDVVREWFFRD